MCHVDARQWCEMRIWYIRGSAIILSIDFWTASEAICTHSKPSILWQEDDLACLFMCVRMFTSMNAASFWSPLKKRNHCSKNYANHQCVLGYMLRKFSVFNNVWFLNPFHSILVSYSLSSTFFSSFLFDSHSLFCVHMLHQICVWVCWHCQWQRLM